MSNIRLGKVASNAAWIIGCKIVQAIIALVVTMLTARYLGPANYGLINYAASITAFFVPLMSLGLSGVLVQEFVDNPQCEGEILGSALCACLLSAFASIVGIVAFTYIVDAGEKDTNIVCILYSINLLFQALEMGRFWYQANYLAKYASLISFGAYLLVAAYKVYLLVSGKSVYWFAISNALDYLIISSAQLYYYKRIGGRKIVVSLNSMHRLISKGKYFIISNIMIVVFAQTDKIMLKLMIGTDATGYYSAASTCAGLLSFVFVAIIDSMRPYVLEGKKESKNEYEKRVRELFGIVLYLSIITSIIMTAFSSVIIKVLYGSAYNEAIPALRIIAWYLVFSYLGGAKDVWILAEEKQKYLMVLNMSGAIANIGLNLALIPLYGISGAAYASLATQLITNVIMLSIITDLKPCAYLMKDSTNPRIVIGLIRNIRKC